MKLSPRLIAATRWILLGGACLVTAVALIVVVENWRGDRAWSHLQSELLRRGERLDLAAFQPPVVRDHENFFKAPLLARLLYERPDDAARQSLINDSRLEAFEVLGRFRGDLKDFSALREAMRKKGLLKEEPTDSPASDVLRAMSPLDPLLEDIRTATLSRPLAALEQRIHPFDPPHIAADAIFRLGQALGIHAAAQIELGGADRAYQDIISVQRLANELAAPPMTLLMVLVGNALHGIAAGVILDGCQRHVWTDAQLAAFQGQYAEFNPLGRFAAAIRCERAAYLHILDSRPELIAKDFRFPPWLFFNGWAQQNKVTYCLRVDAEIISAIGTNPDRIFAERLPKTSETLSRHPYRNVASFALNNIGKILNGVADQAEVLRLNSIAWALERYRLSHGRPPENLEELVPKFLPNIPVGIFDGKPLRYQPTVGRLPLLYAQGRNAADDGGTGDDISLKFPDRS